MFCSINPEEGYHYARIEVSKEEFSLIYKLRREKGMTTETKKAIEDLTSDPKCFDEEVKRAKKEGTIYLSEYLESLWRDEGKDDTGVDWGEVADAVIEATKV